MRRLMIEMTFMTCLVLFLGVVGVKLSYQALVDPPIDQSTGNWVHIPSKILPTKKVIYVKKRAGHQSTGFFEKWKRRISERTQKEKID